MEQEGKKAFSEPHLKYAAAKCKEELQPRALDLLYVTNFMALEMHQEELRINMLGSPSKLMS